jgi:adenine/guanine phosphoribosyltransferase-like PRPP-binding protein
MKAHLFEYFCMETHMRVLKERILLEGKNLGNGILKVDGFINHQVDPMLMDACGRELARRFKAIGATKVLTAEISGIAPAVLTALPVNTSQSPCPIKSFLPLAHLTPKGAWLN